MRWAAVFPGQGSQKIGMLLEYAETFAHILQPVFQEAEEILGYDLAALLRDGPEDTLNDTTHAQPAMLVADVALWRCWCASTDARPVVMAGHSLGEYAALVASEMLTLRDALLLVKTRAQLMSQAVEKGVGGMAAIMGATQDELEFWCENAGPPGSVQPANLNGGGQIVIAGIQQAVQKVLDQALAAGKRGKILRVSVPCHCSLMQPVAEKFPQALQTAAFQAAKCPVLANIDANRHTSSEWGGVLVAQLTQPVFWEKTIQQMAQQYHVEYAIEIGPGRVLTGLNKRILSAEVALSTETPEMMQAAIHTIKTAKEGPA